jgi:hypothetical protein
MQVSDPADIVALENAFDSAERDAHSLVTGLAEELGTWRSDATSWSVAQCLDHLATGHRVYLRAMQPVSERALAEGRMRRGPAEPGVIGRCVVWTFEPPVRPYLRLRAPRSIRPRSAPPLAEAVRDFFESHDELRAFLRRYAGIDLAGVHFPNPFIRGVRFSLATGLHILAAHERRHLWQAWRVRGAAERRGLVTGETHPSAPNDSKRDGV